MRRLHNRGEISYSFDYQILPITSKRLYNKDNKVDKIKEINKFIYVTEAGFSEYFPRIEF